MVIKRSLAPGSLPFTWQPRLNLQIFYQASTFLLCPIYYKSLQEGVGRGADGSPEQEVGEESCDMLSSGHAWLLYT